MKNISEYSNHLETLEKQIFNVKKVQLVPQEGGYKNPSSFGIYKEQGGNCLGVVGKSFNPLQPFVVYHNLLDSILSLNLNPNNLKFKEYYNGSKINFELDLKKDTFINKAGKVDDIVYRLNIITGFDGLTKISTSISSFRLICGNGMRVKDKSFNLSYKNTIGNKNVVINFLDNIKFCLKEVENISDYNKLLNKVVISKEKTIEDFVNYILNIKDRENISSNINNKIHRLNYSLDKEFSRTGKNLFGLLNGATYYSNHLAKKSFDNNKEQEEFIMFKSGDTLNKRAQDFISNLV